MAENVEGKARMAKKGMVCIICLHPNHSTEMCFDRDNDKKKCGVGGCQSHHHPTLHGSKMAEIVNCRKAGVQSGGVKSRVEEVTEDEKPEENPEVDDLEEEIGGKGIPEVEVKGGFGNWGGKKGVSNYTRCFSSTTQEMAEERERELTLRWSRWRRNQEQEELKRRVEEPLIASDKVLCIVMRVNLVFGEMREHYSVFGLFDGGSDHSLILNAVAKHLKLVGRPVQIRIDTVTGPQEVESSLYAVELINRHQQRKVIRAYGVERISDKIREVNLDGIKHKFSEKVTKNWGAVQDRPHGGALGLLVGVEEAGLMPKEIERVDNLIMLETEFGTGLTAFGWDPEIKGGECTLSEEVRSIRRGGIQTAPMNIRRVDLRLRDPEEESLTKIKESEKVNEIERKNNEKVGVRKTGLEEFMFAEDLGVEAPRRCTDCKGCTTCNFRGQRHSAQETLEYELIERAVVYDPDIGRFRVGYVFTGDPYQLGNNFSQAVKIAEREENLLTKEGLMEEFNDKILETMGLNYLEEFTRGEIDSWKGPIHYVSLQHVINPNSTTTRMRIVVNSSLRCPISGMTLNELMAKGPNVLSSLWDTLLRFRSYRRGAIGDITKAYQSILTGMLEKHLRRVVWRFGKKGEPWRIFGFMVVTFGDRQAAVILEIVIRRTCTMFGSIDLDAAFKLYNDRMADDITTGGEAEEVNRYIGDLVEGTQERTGTMPRIMEKGGLKIKALTKSYEKDGESMRLLGGAVLGIPCNLERDTFNMKFRVNVSPRKRREPTGPDLTTDTVGELKNVRWTQRLCVSITNTQFDPLGFASPIIIRLKVLVKKITYQTYKLSWDDILPDELGTEWAELLKMLVQAPDLEFDRSFLPSMGGLELIFVAFWDGSNVAYASVIYAVWRNEQGEGVEVKLVASKAKVNKDWDMNTVRAEMNGAVLNMRLAVSVVRGSKAKPVKVIVAGDSETVLASRCKNAGYFNEWFSNRIGSTIDDQKKIEEICPIGAEGEWVHIPGTLNPADRPTRLVTKVEELMKGREWQNGAAFLREPEVNWPVDTNYAEKKNSIKIPRQEVNKKYRDLIDGTEVNIRLGQLEVLGKQIEEGGGKPRDTDVVAELTDDLRGPEHPNNPIVEKFQGGYITNDWEKLIRRTANLFKWITVIVKKNTEQKEVNERDMAKAFWIQVAMVETRKAHAKGKLTKLTLWEKDGMIIVSGRASEGLKHFFGAEYLPVIMGHTRVGFLIMMWAHNKDHAGRDTTVVTATQFAWIVGAKKLAAKITQLCVRCRFLRRQLEGQKMAPLPPRLTVPCPPFTNVAIDLLGPFKLKKMGGSKVTRGNQGTIKGWALLVLCQNVKAVKLYLIEGYATCNFLMAYDQHVADHGNPTFIHSDRGSQLVCAAKEVEQPEFDWKEIERETDPRSKWIFCPSGCQFRNGGAEAFVKKTKRTLNIMYADRGLNYQEMNTALKKVSSVLNSRPISATCSSKGVIDPDFITALTPNMMLLGRANCDIPTRKYEDSSSSMARVAYVEEVVAAWWCQHKVQDFAGLVPTQKWREERRCMQKGDIVLIWYSSKSKAGDYRLGRIVWTEVDDDGLVRTVGVKYSLVQNLTEKEKLKYTGIKVKYLRTAVQRLVLIVPREEQDNFVDITKEEEERAMDEALSEEQKKEVQEKTRNRVRNNLTSMTKKKISCFRTMLRDRVAYEKIRNQKEDLFEFYGRTVVEACRKLQGEVRN